jgi:serine/threonine protein phosphatase 1
MRIAVGDVHGCYKTLKALLEKRLKIQPEDFVYIVGDLIDRGPYSKHVVDYILDKKEKGFQIEVVRGNHEELIINTYLDQTEDNYLLWMMNGAESTLQSYNIESYKYEGVVAVNHVPEEHISFLRSLPYYIELNNSFIVHAGLDFQAEEPLKNYSEMIWSRELSYTEQETRGKMIVHGHTPIPVAIVKEYFQKTGKIEVNIDTGCVYKDRHPGMGYLTAFDLDTFQFYTIENRDF